MIADPSLALRPVGDADIAACHGLMRQLRPHLADRQAFVAQWRRQTAAGYRLIALWAGDRPVALAGCRVQETFVHGRFLYVDDLVCDHALRGRGLGARLMRAIEEQARADGCAKVVLDTGLDNVLGHRFYYRHGLVAMALRFHRGLS